MHKVQRVFSNVLADRVQGAFPVPDLTRSYDPVEFPHWFIFQVVHLDEIFPDKVMEYNARIIASLNEEQIKLCSLDMLEGLGIITGPEAFFREDEVSA